MAAYLKLNQFNTLFTYIPDNNVKDGLPKVGIMVTSMCIIIS